MIMTSHAVVKELLSSETLIEDSTATLLEHLPHLKHYLLLHTVCPLCYDGSAYTHGGQAPGRTRNGRCRGGGSGDRLPAPGGRSRTLPHADGQDRRLPTLHHGRREAS